MESCSETKWPYKLSWRTPKKFTLVPIDKASCNVASVCKQHSVEVKLNEIGVIGRGNNTYCKATKNCDEIMDENIEYTKRLGFKITQKEKNTPGYVLDS